MVRLIAVVLVAVVALTAWLTRSLWRGDEPRRRQTRAHSSERDARPPCLATRCAAGRWTQRP